MSANHSRLVALVVWAEVVLVLAYWKWWPRPLDYADLTANERAYILRLADDGILTRMIDQGRLVSLAILEPPKPPAPEAGGVTAPQKGSAKGPEPEKKGKAPESTAPSKAGAPQKKENSPEEAAALAPASTATSVVEHARVLDKICKVEIQSATRVVVCYAAIAVPAERMAALTRAADKVAVWVEGKE